MPTLTAPAAADTAMPFESWCDDLGPSRVVHLYDPATGLRGIVVVDNTAVALARKRVLEAMSFRRTS